jgi:hypothetical protein
MQIGEMSKEGGEPQPTPVEEARTAKQVLWLLTCGRIYCACREVTAYCREAIGHGATQPRSSSVLVCSWCLQFGQ